MTSEGEAEGEHVASSVALPVGLRKVREVVGVVKLAGALKGDIAAQERTETVEAGAASGHRVDTPIHVKRAAVLVGSRQNPAIDDGDEVTVCDEVEDGARPGPVNARDENIAVQGGGQTLRGQDARRYRFGVKDARGVTDLGGPLGDGDLGQVLVDVLRPRVEGSVEVARLDDVVIDVGDVLDAEPVERLGNDAADADRAGVRDAELRGGCSPAGSRAADAAVAVIAIGAQSGST